MDLSLSKKPNIRGTLERMKIIAPPGVMIFLQPETKKNAIVAIPI